MRKWLASLLCAGLLGNCTPAGAQVPEAELEALYGPASAGTGIRTTAIVGAYIKTASKSGNVLTLIYQDDTLPVPVEREFIYTPTVGGGADGVLTAVSLDVTSQILTLTTSVGGPYTVDLSVLTNDLSSRLDTMDVLNTEQDRNLSSLISTESVLKIERFYAHHGVTYPAISQFAYDSGTDTITTTNTTWTTTRNDLFVDILAVRQDHQFDEYELKIIRGPLEERVTFVSGGATYDNLDFVQLDQSISIIDRPTLGGELGVLLRALGSYQSTHISGTTYGLSDTVSAAGLLWTCIDVSLCNADGLPTNTPGSGWVSIEGVTPDLVREALNLTESETNNLLVAISVSGDTITFTENDGGTTNFTGGTVPEASETVSGTVRGITIAEIDSDSGSDFRGWTVNRLRRALRRLVVDWAEFDSTETIPADRLPDATFTARGIVELATNAETESGTSTVRATTPSGVAQAISRTAGIYRGDHSFGSLYRNGDTVTYPVGTERLFMVLDSDTATVNNPGTADSGWAEITDAPAAITVSDADLNVSDPSAESTTEAASRQSIAEAVAEAAFDLHDDIATQIPSLSASDRLLVSDENVSGDPNRYTTLAILQTSIAGAAFIRAQLGLTSTEANNLFVDASQTGNTVSFTQNDGGVFTFNLTGSGGGSDTFVGLTDTPSALGQGGQSVIVNAGRTALEFSALEGLPPGGVRGQAVQRTGSGSEWGVRLYREDDNGDFPTLTVADIGQSLGIGADGLYHVEGQPYPETDPSGTWGPVGGSIDNDSSIKTGFLGAARNVGIAGGPDPERASVGQYILDVDDRQFFSVVQFNANLRIWRIRNDPDDWLGFGTRNQLLHRASAVGDWGYNTDNSAAEYLTLFAAGSPAHVEPYWTNGLTADAARSAAIQDLDNFEDDIPESARRKILMERANSGSAAPTAAGIALSTDPHTWRFTPAHGHNGAGFDASEYGALTPIHNITRLVQDPGAGLPGLGRVTLHVSSTGRVPRQNNLCLYFRPHGSTGNWRSVGLSGGSDGTYESASQSSYRFGDRAGTAQDVLFRTVSCSDSGNHSTVPANDRIESYADGVKFGQFVLDTDLGHVDEVVRHDPRIPNPGDNDNDKVLGVVSGEYALVEDQTGTGSGVQLRDGGVILTDDLKVLRLNAGISCVEGDPDDIWCGTPTDLLAAGDVEDFAKTASPDANIPTARLPGAVTLDSEVSGALSGAVGSTNSNYFRTTFSTIGGGSQTVDVPTATFSAAGVVRGVGTSNIDNETEPDVFKSWSINRFQRMTHRLIPVWAQAGNTDTLPDTKLASTITRDTELNDLFDGVFVTPISTGTVLSLGQRDGGTSSVTIPFGPGGGGTADGVADSFTASHQDGLLYFTLGRTLGLDDLTDNVTLPSATSTNPGIVEFATNAEAEGGQLANRALTPSNLAPLFGLFVSNNALNISSPNSEPTGIAASRRAVATAVSNVGGGSAFNLHDDVTTQIPVISLLDRWVVSAEGLSGDPNRYATSEQMRDYFGSDLFDLHDDVPTRLTTFEGVDRVLVSDESNSGDPNRYARLEDIGGYLVTPSTVRTALGLTTAEANSLFHGASISGNTLTFSRNNAVDLDITLPTVGGGSFDLHDDVPGSDTAIASADRIVFSNEGTAGDPNSWGSFATVFDGVRDVVTVNNSVPAGDDRIFLSDENESGDPLEWTTVDQLGDVIGGVNVAANPTVDDDDPEVDSLTIGTTDYRVAHPHRGPYDDTRDYRIGDIVSTGSGDEEIFWIASGSVDAGQGAPTQDNIGLWWSLASHGFYRGIVDDALTYHMYPGDTWIFGDHFYLSLIERTALTGNALSTSENGVLNISEKLRVLVGQSRPPGWLDTHTRLSLDGTGITTSVENGVPTARFGIPWLQGEENDGEIDEITTAGGTHKALLSEPGGGNETNKLITLANLARELSGLGAEVFVDTLDDTTGVDWTSNTWNDPDARFDLDRAIITADDDRLFSVIINTDYADDDGINVLRNIVFSWQFSSEAFRRLESRTDLTRTDIDNSIRHFVRRGAVNSPPIAGTPLEVALMLSRQRLTNGDDRMVFSLNDHSSNNTNLVNLKIKVKLQ